MECYINVVIGDLVKNKVKNGQLWVLHFSEYSASIGYHNCQSCRNKEHDNKLVLKETALWKALPN